MGDSIDHGFPQHQLPHEHMVAEHSLYGAETQSQHQIITENRSPSLAEAVEPDAEYIGKIFVGGLSWQTTRETLQFHFEKFGELVDVAILLDRHSGHPRGFGFVTFLNPAAADLVISQEHNIDGRAVDVKKAVSRNKAPGRTHGQPSITNPPPNLIQPNKLFVGGLASHATEKDLLEHFSQFGPVLDTCIMMDRKTNRSRGFGFVTFDSDEAIALCLRSNNEILGKWVEVKRAEPRVEAGAPPAHTYGGGYPSPYGVPPYGMPGYGVPEYSAMPAYPPPIPGYLPGYDGGRGYSPSGYTPPLPSYPSEYPYTPEVGTALPPFPQGAQPYDESLPGEEGILPPGPVNGYHSRNHRGGPGGRHGGRIGGRRRGGRHPSMSLRDTGGVFGQGGLRPDHHVSSY